MNIESSLNEDATPKPAAKPRRTPTQKQIEVLSSLDDEQLVAKALTALHALNRRAKKIRDHRAEYRRASFAKALEEELERIYDLKDSFLEVLVLTGRATVYTFEIDPSRDEDPCEMNCEGCGRSWFGNAWCYECDDASGEPVPETWYVVDCGSGYRFHQPEESVSEEVADLAVKIPPHDPNQPQREIPKIGLTIEAQKTCVRLATERLAVACEDDPASGDAPEGDA